jgi:hypothetical protein
MPENAPKRVWLRRATASVRSYVADWQRARAERAEQHERESLDIGKWLSVDPGNPTGFAAVVADGESAVMELTARRLPATTLPRPVSSARRTPTREFVCTRIQMMTVPVEPEWDVPTMIDAHRNGATALERPMQEIDGDDPVWQELVVQKWDPTHEIGPRERDYVRKLAKR